jgi:four helix bundle protein
LETQHWIEVALDCGYISNEVAANFLKQYTSIGNMLNSMILKSVSFCKPKTKDLK